MCEEPKTRATIEAALREVGLPTELADAGDSTAYDQALRESHQEGITLVGAEVGSPIIAVPAADPADSKIAFFGPVVSPAPSGDQAARLWDGILAAASTPGFYEIKRTRTVGPIFDQATPATTGAACGHDGGLHLRRNPRAE
jgi:hypothetical protein